MVIKVVVRDFGEYNRGPSKPGEPINLFRECIRTAVGKDSILEYCIESIACHDCYPRTKLTEIILPVDGYWTSEQLEDILVYVFGYIHYDCYKWRKEIFREASFFQWLVKHGEFRSLSFHQSDDNGKLVLRERVEYNEKDLYIIIGKRRFWRCETEKDILNLLRTIERWMLW